MSSGAQFPPLGAERWLARRLEQPHMFAIGVTTPEDRRELIRGRILELGVESEYAGRLLGKPKNFGEVFQDFYGQPLNGESDDGNERTD